MPLTFSFSSSFLSSLCLSLKVWRCRINYLTPYLISLQSPVVISMFLIVRVEKLMPKLAVMLRGGLIIDITFEGRHPTSFSLPFK